MRVEALEKPKAKERQRALAAVRAERDENALRKPLTAEEATEVSERWETIEKAEAAKRKRSGINQHTKPSGKFPEGSTGQTRDKVGAAVGVSGRTYEKMRQIADAAKADPEKYGDLSPEQLKTACKVFHAKLAALADAAGEGGGE